MHIDLACTLLSFHLVFVHCYSYTILYDVFNTSYYLYVQINTFVVIHMLPEVSMQKINMVLPAMSVPVVPFSKDGDDKR